MVLRERASKPASGRMNRMRSESEVQGRILEIQDRILELEQNSEAQGGNLALQTAILVCEQEIISLRWVLGEEEKG